MTDHLTSFFPAGRDRGVTVVVEGFFAFVWFGWGQAAPPSWLVVPLAVGDGLAVLLTVAGVVLTTRSAGPLRVMADPAVRRRCGSAPASALHFFPLASTLANRSLRLLGVLLIGVAAAALATGLASATAPSTVTGAGAGLCLLAFGLATLLTAWRRPAVKIEVAPSLPRSVRWLTVASISTGRGKHERTVA